MAQSRSTKMIRFFIRLMLAAFLFVFMPMLVFKGACGEKRDATLDEAYGTGEAPTLGEAREDAPPKTAPLPDQKPKQDPPN